MTQGQNPVLQLLFFVNKVLLKNPTTPIHLPVVYGCLCYKTELSSHVRDCVIHEA